MKHTVTYVCVHSVLFLLHVVRQIGCSRMSFSGVFRAVLSWVELSLNICIPLRTRWSVTTAPDDGSRMLEKLSLQPVLEGAQRQFGGA